MQVHYSTRRMWDQYHGEIATWVMAQIVMTTDPTTSNHSDQDALRDSGRDKHTTREG
jgi:hypothetical protein